MGLMSKLFATAFCTLVVTSRLAESVATRPNIIFMVVDDWGFYDMAFKSGEIDTPNLDKFYQDSISLDMHYGEAVCTPSRAQILTGRYAFNMGVQSMIFDYARVNSMPAGIPTMAELLQNYGNYNTYLVGKWHVGYAANELTPLMRGFDEFYGWLGAGISYSDKTVKSKIDGQNDYYLDWFNNEEVDYDTKDTFSTFVTRDYMLDILDNYDTSSNKPFYIYNSWQAAHRKLETVEEYESNCANIDSANSFGEKRYQYCTNLVAVDVAIGEVMDKLASKPEIADNTIIIFTNDNGGMSSEGGCNYPLRGEKGSYFEGGVRLRAFFNAGKNIVAKEQRGTVRSELFHQSDWAPTLLSLAGIDLNEVNSDLREIVYDNDSEMNVFDGYDMKNYLLSNNVFEHQRNDVPLSVSSEFTFESESLETDNAIVFKSAYDSHFYKYIFVSDTADSNYGGYCDYNTITDKYSHKSGDLTEHELMFDLTLDERESHNLLSDEIGGNANSLKLYQKIKNEGKSLLMKYKTENKFFNDELSCQFDNYFQSESDPSQFDEPAWKPFFTFDEYVEHFTEICGDDVNDDLYKLYTTTYSEQVSKYNKLKTKNSQKVSSNNNRDGIKAVDTMKTHVNSKNNNSILRNKYVWFVALAAFVVVSVVLGVLKLKNNKLSNITKSFNANEQSPLIAVN